MSTPEQICQKSVFFPGPCVLQHMGMRAWLLKNVVIFFLKSRSVILNKGFLSWIVSRCIVGSDENSVFTHTHTRTHNTFPMLEMLKGFTDNPNIAHRACDKKIFSHTHTHARTHKHTHTQHLSKLSRKQKSSHFTQARTQTHCCPQILFSILSLHCVSLLINTHVSHTHAHTLSRPAVVVMQ